MANIMRIGGAAGGGKKAPAIFGDGSDGVGLFGADTTWSAETEDTGMIVKQFESLTIAEGVTVSAGNRNCGMIIRVQGDCIINGTLANKLSCKTLLSSDNVDFSSWPLTMLSGKAGDGGAGGKGGYTMGYTDTQRDGGAGMAGRFYGGGWSGGGAGAGWVLDSWTKYVGGHGGAADTITTATPDADLFKAGENKDYSGLNNRTYYANAGTAGGAGGTITYGGMVSHIAKGPGGSPANYPVNASGSTSGGNGNIGGGVIILLVGGNLTITGVIDCSGGAGGHGGNKTEALNYPGGGGAGGAGGGRIFICHQGTISNTGTLNVAGGAAGAAGNPNNLQGSAGTAGGDGTTAIKTYDQYLEEDVA